MMIGTGNTIRMAYNALTATNKAIENTSRALSTGLRAATAADDAAGFAMGMNISAQIAGVDRAIRNSQDGISMLQTAEGALNQINSMLQRMRELAVQSANDSLTTQDRSYIQLEIDELRDNIDNIASNTTFNCKRLLDGSSSAIWSSDDEKVSLSVSGAVTSLDQFGQRKNTAGNYKIEISAKAGKAEVQKSNIFELEVSEEYLTEETAADGDTVHVMRTRQRAATLRDMTAMKDNSGAFIMNEPQKIQIIQGDGKTAEVVLYAEDTLYDVSRKINNAIADDLGQLSYADNRENFCSVASGAPDTSEAVRYSETVYSRAYLRDIDTRSATYGQLILNQFGTPQEITPGDYGDYEAEDLEELLSFRDEVTTTKATLVIRSAIAGADGKLTFTSENNDLINALNLNTIQEAEENIFSMSIYDAHTGKAIAENLATDGNRVDGVISPNIGITFDAMANVRSVWDETTKRYVIQNEAEDYSTIVHIDDRSTSFQIGQNVGEDIYINIGDMRAKALGLNRVDVSTRARASESITLLDSAIHKVGSQRAKIGSYQNELEYNANSLTQTSKHMQEAESRLKDADMAKEYMEFIKLQILNGTGNSMLAQANQNSQNIMGLLLQ
ncbi:MAG: hypothetical protein IJP53_02565 [Synergistaceae bacterium]|nr:hypothetical protein [Synergistaceae bacterium]MBR0094702.1 hypothetical protein [Synergistaceae bacterium]